ncbi:hypothetical protein ACAD36_00098 [Clavibacter nebraskensis]|jgi:hypothetical protein
MGVPREQAHVTGWHPAKQATAGGVSELLSAHDEGPGPSGIPALPCGARYTSQRCDRTIGSRRQARPSPKVSPAERYATTIRASA